MGILNIEKYYDLDPKDIIRGVIEYGGKIYESKSKLSTEDVKLIAYAARNLDRLDSHASWMGSDSGLKHEYDVAVEEHDKALEDYKNTRAKKISTFLDPISRNASEMAHMFREMHTKDFNSVCLDEEKRGLCFQEFKFEKRKEVCKDPGSNSLPYPENNCSNLHYQDPYLKLGPFKLEHLNTEPFIEIVHDVLYDEEMEWLKLVSRGMMRTSYYSSNSGDISNLGHTSKTAYHSERTYSYLAKLSRRLELTTALNIFNPRYRYGNNSFTG